MKVTLDELQAFAAVVDTGSITAAAQQLGLTVSATSRTLGRLEEKLKTTLLRRTTRRLALTDEGEAFLRNARSIIDAVENAEAQMLTRREKPSGRLRVDAATPFMLHVIVPLVAGYRERYPEVELELHSNEGIIDLLERRTDVAIRIGHLKDSTLHSRLIGHSRVRILASPAYLQAHGTPRKAEDLASIRCWDSVNPNRSTHGRLPAPAPTARRTGSCRTSCRRAAKHCASWRSKARES